MFAPLGMNDVVTEPADLADNDLAATGYTWDAGKNKFVKRATPSAGAVAPAVGLCMAPKT